MHASCYWSSCFVMWSSCHNTTSSCRFVHSQILKTTLSYRLNLLWLHCILNLLTTVTDAHSIQLINKIILSNYFACGWRGGCAQFFFFLIETTTFQALTTTAGALRLSLFRIRFAGNYTALFFPTQLLWSIWSCATAMRIAFLENTFAHRSSSVSCGLGDATCCRW